MNHIRLCLEEIEDNMARIYSRIKKHLSMEIYCFHKSRTAISNPQSSDISSINTQDLFRMSADFSYIQESFVRRVSISEKRFLNSLSIL